MAALITEIARAKVNLALHVVGRRPDGYHLLDTLVVFPDVGDRLTAEPARDIRLTVTGPEGDALAATPVEDNLVMRAARGLHDRVPGRDGIHLTLHKTLPVSSGIGGGSADAAAALRLACRIWEIDPRAPAVTALARELGADVPMCLDGRPLRATGIGQDITTLPAPPALGILLANPRLGVSTPDVFRALARRENPGLVGVPSSASDYPAMIAAARNDLETPARQIEPAIGDVLAALAGLDGVMIARMSGSGATCFALLPTRQWAERAAAQLRSFRPEWWIRAAAIG